MPRSARIKDLSQQMGVPLKETRNWTELKSWKGPQHYLLDDAGDIIGLNLYRIPMKNPNFLGALKKIKFLDISYTGLSDDDFLQSMTSLEELDISGNNISNLQVLKGLQSLKHLSANKNSLTDLWIASDLVQLEILEIESNHISLFFPLRNLPNLRGLRMGKNPIVDYEFFNDLKDLKELDITGQKVPTFSFLDRLTQLESLALRGTGCFYCPSFSTLTKLKVLDLSENGIKDCEHLSGWPALEELDLSGNYISDCSFLRTMDGLRILNLNGNRLKDLRPISGLTRLEDLELGGCGIADIIFLHPLKNLSTLYLSDNEIREGAVLSEHIDLKILMLKKNRIEDISFCRDLINLTVLDLSKNVISDLSPLTDLVNLETLNIEYNRVTDLTPLWPQIKKGIPVNLDDTRENAINVRGAAINNPPIEVLKEGNDAIHRFFEKISNEGLDFIYEAKLTLVGDGSSGKTSLQVRLLDEMGALPGNDTRTRGIQIFDWNFGLPEGEKKIAHIWDFGGQDVYYPVHRFFLTENSVFVLLATTRHALHNFDYWIPTIFQFGGESPIILGQTCHDGNKIAWNDIGNYLSNPHFNIIKSQQLPYHELDLLNDNEGLEAIKQAIIYQINNLPHFGKGVPKSWVEARTVISVEAKQRACISFEAFMDLCRSPDPSKFPTETHVEDLGKFLHSLGIIIWYSDHDELRNWVILQPEWTMNAVYKIIDDPEIQARRGIILASDFPRLWNDKNYSNRHDILQKMLQIFKIAFPKRHIKTDYIIPARLYSIPSEEIWSSTESYLRLEYQYEFMPKGLINQVSAELSDLIISDQDVWNNAVNLKFENSSKAQVLEDFFSRKIFIKAKGKDARGLVMIIMKAFKDITDGYKGVTPVIIVPCSCETCRNSSKPTRFAYDDLLRWFEKRPRVTCNESGDSVKIDELLYNVGLDRSVGEKPGEPTKSGGRSLLRAFISYSKFDGESHKDGINFLQEF